MRHLHLVPCPLEGVPVTIRARRPEPRERVFVPMKRDATKSQPKPKGRPKVFGERVDIKARLEPELYRAALETAKDQGVSFNTLCRVAIERLLASGEPVVNESDEAAA
jgi:hypothetical protein